MDYKEKLEDLEEKINEAKTKKIKLQAKKEQLEKEKEAIMKELAEEDLTIEGLAETISKLEKDIKAGIEELEEQVNG